MILTLAPETEARLQALATRRNQAPEAVVDAALEELWQKEPMQDAPAEDAEESDPG